VAFLSNGNVIANPSPAVNQMYQAAHSGNMVETQNMMNQLLNDHPNSAKAYFVGPKGHPNRFGL
jgi:hypothetical protein